MDLVERLRYEGNPANEELRELLTTTDSALVERLRAAAEGLTVENFGHGIYLRGLIEVSNICRNDCRYCGIRCSNRNVERYRLDSAAILGCCEEGYGLGLRTFVLQGGEDPALGDDFLVPLVGEIRRRYPDCAITLSLGERTEESYRALFEAGATRYLLRHETIDQEHYAHLHPARMSLEGRIGCLRTLKRIGYQTGTGIMVGSPGQTIDTIVADLRFMADLQPEMIGIGPFLPHCDTPFRDEPAGSLDLTLRLISILRLMHPRALIPATTSLATITPDGRARGILAGANVVMPNLSPAAERHKYMLYDNKAFVGTESVEGLRALETEFSKICRHADFSRGDYKK